MHFVCLVDTYEMENAQIGWVGVRISTATHELLEIKGVACRRDTFGTVSLPQNVC